MGKSGERFMQHREELAWEERAELARREYEYLDKRLKDRNVKEQTARDDRAQKPKR